MYEIAFSCSQFAVFCTNICMSLCVPIEKLTLPLLVVFNQKLSNSTLKTQVNKIDSTVSVRYDTVRIYNVYLVQDDLEC